MDEGSVWLKIHPSDLLVEVGPALEVPDPDLDPKVVLVPDLEVVDPDLDLRDDPGLDLRAVPAPDLDLEVEDVLDHEVEVAPALAHLADPSHDPGLAPDHVHEVERMADDQLVEASPQQAQSLVKTA